MSLEKLRRGTARRKEDREMGDKEIESVINLRIDQDRTLLRPALRDYGGQVAHDASTKDQDLRRSFQV